MLCPYCQYNDADMIETCKIENIYTRYKCDHCGTEYTIYHNRTFSPHIMEEIKTVQTIVRSTAPNLIQEKIVRKDWENGVHTTTYENAKLVQNHHQNRFMMTGPYSVVICQEHCPFYHTMIGRCVECDCNQCGIYHEAKSALKRSRKTFERFMRKEGKRIIRKQVKERERQNKPQPIEITIKLPKKRKSLAERFMCHIEFKGDKNETLQQ